MTQADVHEAGTATGHPDAGPWTPVCLLGDLVPERGVAALVGGAQVAVFRLHDGSLRAVGHLDPFSGAYVMARGIVGTRGDVPTVASPMYKQAFDLRTGACLDDPAACLPAHPVRVTGEGVVEIAGGIAADGTVGARQT